MKWLFEAHNVLNMWVKIAHIETGSGANNYASMKLILAAGSMAHIRYDTAIIDFVVKRQLGSVSGIGAVILKLSNNNKIQKENFKAVLIQDDANNSVVDLYIQFTTQWTMYNFSPLVAMGSAPVMNAIASGGAVSSVPAGLAQYNCSYYDVSVESLNVSGALNVKDSNGNIIANIDNTGIIKPSGYKSADGSTGASGSFTSADGKTVTVKNGLITSIV